MSFQSNNSYSVVQLLSRVRLLVTPWTVAHQASFSFTISWSLLKFMSLSWWCHPTTFFLFFSVPVYHRITEQTSLCYLVGPYWLSILCVIVCIAFLNWTDFHYFTRSGGANIEFTGSLTVYHVRCVVWFNTCQFNKAWLVFSLTDRKMTKRSVTL